MAAIDSILALRVIAHWIDDLPGVDDATAMVHSAALREAASLIESQSKTISTLLESKQDD